MYIMQKSKYLTHWKTLSVRVLSQTTKVSITSSMSKSFLKISECVGNERQFFQYTLRSALHKFIIYI